MQVRLKPKKFDSKSELINKNRHFNFSNFLNSHIISIRYQLWPLDKKLRVVRQAKDYLNKHASEVEQRLAQDRTFKGRLQTYKLKFIKWIQVIPV